VVGKGTIILLRLKEQSSIDLNNIDKIAMVQPLEEINVIKGRFLIIDDEVEIRKSISRVLVGCTIVEAESGEIAKNILKNDRAFDYILCDMMMSNISGIDLYEWLMQESPLLAGKIIFTTGGAFTARAQAIFKNIGNRKIEKPFTVEMLRRALNQLIKSP
jgi:CheY-like chemotaxis protein